MKNVNLMPKPVQKPHPPIWIAAMAEKSVARVARMGYHLAGSGGVDLQQMYDSGLRHAGHDVAGHYIAQLRAVTWPRRGDQAWDDAEQHLYYMMTAYNRRFKEANDLPWSEAVFSRSDVPPPGEMRNTPGLSFFQAPMAMGSPDDVVRDLEQYREAGRVTHLVMWMQLPGMPAHKARRSMELFAKEVMPRLR